jgi:hypothetical protein
MIWILLSILILLVCLCRIGFTHLTHPKPLPFERHSGYEPPHHMRIVPPPYDWSKDPDA